ncbi:MAG: PH domain-containing protein [Candidatus Acidiferrales bacterium]|jgi:uncharacterized membrane protein YdbT with pleckstrin-like domain
MDYIEKNLISGEQILYRTRLHSIAVFFPLLVGTAAVLGGVFCLYASVIHHQGIEDSKLWVAAGLILIVLGGIIVAGAILKRNATEMAVTNRRILIKSGIMSRRTIELLLSRVESIVITEPFFGRMLGYGAVIVRGTGGTPEPFTLIANPTEFRRHVQEQIEAGQAQIRPAGIPPS